MLNGFIRQFMQAASAIAVTFEAGNWAVHYANEIRGYEAAGGEYLFILSVYISAYAGSSWLIDILEELHCQRISQRQKSESDRNDKGVTGRC